MAERGLMSFQKRLSSGEFVILAQMNTPKGVNISEMVNNARRIKERVHGVIIPDMDNGVMRMSALAGGALMRQQGLEPIMHVYGRDKNRMALQGDILAAYVLGIQNLVVVPLTFLSGAFYSLSSVSVSWRWLSRINPLFYFVDACRFGFLGTSDVPPVTSLLVASLSTGLTLAAAIALVARGHRLRN